MNFTLDDYNNIMRGNGVVGGQRKMKRGGKIVGGRVVGGVTVGGKKRKKTKNPWLDYLKAYSAANPELSWKEVMEQASAYYNQYS